MDEAELAPLFFFFSLSLFFFSFLFSHVRVSCLSGWVLQSVPTAVSSHSLYSLIRVSHGSAREFVCTNLIRRSLWRSRGVHSAALRSLGHSLLLEWGPGMRARTCTVRARARACVSVCVSASQELSVYLQLGDESDTKRVFKTKATWRLSRLASLAQCYGFCF